MKQLNRLALFVLAITIAVGYVILPTIPASAESSSLSIAPRKDYLIEPGKSIDDTLTIRNIDTQSPLDLSLHVVDFTYMDNGGSPKFMLDPNASMTTWSLKPFLIAPKNISIAPGSTKSVDIHIAIPAGHGAGTYYSAIFYSSGAPNGGNVGLSATGATLVFVNIPGKVNEDLQLEKFGTYDRSARGDLAGYKSLNFAKPDAIAYTLKNNGNVVENPVGSITLTDLFGRKQVINDINPSKNLALIGQTRTFVSCIKLKPESVKLDGVSSKSVVCDTPDLWPGYYKLSLDLYYGQNGNTTQEIIKSGGFWYLPWWFLFVSVIVLLIAGFYGWKLYRKVNTSLYGPKVKKSSSRRRK